MSQKCSLTILNHGTDLIDRAGETALFLQQPFPEDASLMNEDVDVRPCGMMVVQAHQEHPDSRSQLLALWLCGK